jgi:ferredoxin/predicted O-methyltransferase YrrM
MTAALKIDRRACLGTGLCLALSPQLFTAAGDGRARAARPRLADPEHIELATAAAECCPTGAIVVAPLEEETPRMTRLPAESGEAFITRLWESNYDGLTTSIIQSLDIQPTWRCLDVGAGGGSMSYWLAEHVPQGSVIAVDTDTSMLDPGRYPNLAVEQADIAVKGPDEPGSLDLILMRALLSLVSDPEKLIARAVSWLAPGGWLLAEDFYFMPSTDSPTANGRKVVGAYLGAFETSGANPRVGRKLPAVLAQSGLTQVQTNLRPLGPGQGESENALMRARMELQGQSLIDNGLLTREEIAEFIASLYQPESQDVTTLLFSVWGQRPRN